MFRSRVRVMDGTLDFQILFLYIYKKRIMKDRMKIEEYDYTGEGKILGKILANGQGIQAPPKSVGGYEIDEINVLNLTKKPSWFRRTCTRFFLGLRWIDKREEKTKKNLLLG